tara:strand:+ start:1008 stop:1172 length:165 start_codon:yes stop_codon:yes gene_type:complete
MSGQTITVVGCLVSFALLFGIYMSLRGDFLLKMKDPTDTDEAVSDRAGEDHELS